MKVAIVLIVVVLAVAFAKPLEDKLEDKPVLKILKSEYDQSPEGGYNYSFETENKINRNEVGELKSIKDDEGKDHDVVIIRGSYSYPNPDVVGQQITVNYVADENGFQVEGDHIPKPARK